jgi:hypothetical protein
MTLRFTQPLTEDLSGGKTQQALNVDNLKMIISKALSSLLTIYSSLVFVMAFSLKLFQRIIPQRIISSEKLTVLVVASSFLI